MAHYLLLLKLIYYWLIKFLMNRKQLLKLPSLPLTETYSKTYKGKNSLSYDAELYLDKTLSLVRLDNNLTDIKYDEESYAYRTTSFSNKISP